MGIALIAGKGDLPRQIIQAFQEQPLYIVGFRGQTPVDLAPSLKLFPMGHIGAVLEYLHDNHVKKIVLAGALRRPSWSELSLDKTGAQWLKKLGWKALKGDNDILSGILNLLEGEGFEILKPSDILKTLMASGGCRTLLHPTKQDQQDIQRGVAVLQALSSHDVGQAIVVQQGMVLGIEAAEGTASLIKRCGDLKRHGGGGVLVKIAKTHQDQRVDLPTIGLETLYQLKEAGFLGVAVSTRTTQILQQDVVIEKANQLGLFIIGI